MPPPNPREPRLPIGPVLPPDPEPTPALLFPDVAIHLYTISWFSETNEEARTKLAAALTPIFSELAGLPITPDVVLATDGTSSGGLASIGLWAEHVDTTNKEIAKARRAGLLASRNARLGTTGDLAVRFGFAEQFLRRKFAELPKMIRDAGGPNVQISAVRIVPSNISSGGLRVGLACVVVTDVPVLGLLQNDIGIDVSLIAQPGKGIVVSASNAQVSGDMDWLLALAGAPAALAATKSMMFPVTSINGFEIPAVAVILSMKPQQPKIEIQPPRGFPRERNITVPFSWSIVEAEAQLSGPTRLTMPGPSVAAIYRCATKGMINPTFKWRRNGTLIPSQIGPEARLIFTRGNRAPGTRIRAEVSVEVTHEAGTETASKVAFVTVTEPD